jgi:cell wall-associated NlpC family hydrolase
MRILSVLFFTALLLGAIYCPTSGQQVILPDSSRKKIEAKYNFAVEHGWNKLPIGDLMDRIGRSFIGTDYIAGSLEAAGEEHLIINVDKFDCTTFVENVLAFARYIKKGNPSADSFASELRQIRYRNGIINQYPSRLHYFSDWIYDNIKKHLIKDVTDSLGGEKIKFSLSFMSTHPEFYKKLMENPSFIPVIKKQEEDINRRLYFYIPAGKVAEVEKDIRPGDILAFTSSVDGLDINHVGLAVIGKDKRIHLLHAPLINSKVQITELPIAVYIKKIKKDTGIIISRPLEPKSL